MWLQNQPCATTNLNPCRSKPTTSEPSTASPDAYRDDPEFRALIIGGSVAKGCARVDSDVDFLIVATDEVFERRLAARDLFINRRDPLRLRGRLRRRQDHQPGVP